MLIEMILVKKGCVTQLFYAFVDNLLFTRFSGVWEIIVVTHSLAMETILLYPKQFMVYMGYTEINLSVRGLVSLNLCLELLFQFLTKL